MKIALGEVYNIVRTELLLIKIMQTYFDDLLNMF